MGCTVAKENQYQKAPSTVVSVPAGLSPIIRNSTVSENPTVIFQPAPLPSDRALPIPLEEQLELHLRCSDGNTFTDKFGIVEDIIAAVAERCNVHESCITLTTGMVGGLRLDLDRSQKLLNIIGLESGSTVFATIARDKFPEQLGPFTTVVVPIDGTKFRWLQQAESEFQRNGGMWTLLGKTVRDMGFNFNEDLLMSQVSPTSGITLTPAEKMEANIPEHASQFCWSYPVADREQLGEAKDMKVTYFMKFGAFVYLNSKRWVLQATTLQPALPGTGGGLQFSRPKAWEPTWTKSLEKAGRFQEITVPDFRNVGATHFCWLKPGEKIFGQDGQPLPTQPDVEHGGFVYLFRGYRQRKIDRYFAIVSGDAYQMPTRAGSTAELKDWIKSGTRENLDQVANSTSIPLSVASTSASLPKEWIPAQSGLVKLTNPAIVNCFRLLLENTHKQTDNWTRDRGCIQHGVNKCMHSCIFANKAPVPSRYTLVEVSRNQNLDLWTNYCIFRETLAEECKRGVKPKTIAVISGQPPFDELGGSRLEPGEWRLFHGTSASASASICRRNFDQAKGGSGHTWKSAGHAWGMPLYGFGHYFAENITKADEYSKSDNDVYTVLLCRVAGGRAKIVTASEIDPTALQKEVLEKRAYHSVYGDRVSVLQKPYREVVVYDSKQIFPEFVLKYKRNY